jgi:FkbM family methyltransferase
MRKILQARNFSSPISGSGSQRLHRSVLIAGLAFAAIVLLAVAGTGGGGGHFDVVEKLEKDPTGPPPVKTNHLSAAFASPNGKQQQQQGADDIPHHSSSSSSAASLAHSSSRGGGASQKTGSEYRIGRPPTESDQEDPEASIRRHKTFIKRRSFAAAAATRSAEILPLLSDTEKVSYAVGVPASEKDRAGGSLPGVHKEVHFIDDAAARQPCGDYNLPINTRTTPSTKLCHHGSSDTIGSYVLRDGFWKDCLVLPHLALFAHAFSNVAYEDGMPAAVDVGANVGSCSMLLASRGMHVVAFEPVQRNFRKFHQSIRLSKFSNRITLVTAAASTKSGTAEITIERSNNGNSIIIDKSIEAGVKMDQLFRPASDVEEIALVKLDDVIDLGVAPDSAGRGYHVHLLKMDCQGSEYKALLGATRLLERGGVDVIFSEVDTRIMRATNSEPADMLRYLWKFNFSIFYAQKNRETSQREVVLLEQRNTDAFVEKCIEDPTDFTAVSTTILGNAGGVNVIERLLLVTYDELQQWLTANPPTKPQPAVDYSAVSELSAVLVAA